MKLDSGQNQAPGRVLAIDVGTSSVKAAVLDVATARPVTAITRAAYTFDSPTPDAAEIPVERVWAAVVGAVRELGSREGLGPINGIGLSCLTPALVLLDGKDEALLPAWIHLDRRARAPALAVWEDVGPEFLATTGNAPLPGGMSALCLRKILVDRPDLGERIASYLHLNGWLGFRLTGVKAFDPANASFTGLFSTMGDQRWSDRWLAYFQAKREWMPPILPGDAWLGGLCVSAAGELGLPPGVKVKVGTADTTSAMLAAGLREGELLHVVGTTQVLATPVKKPVPGLRRLVRRLGVGETFIHVTHNPVGGAALEWIHGLCFSEEAPHHFFDVTVPLAGAHATNVTLDPPFLGGDRLELEAKDAGFRHLTLGSRRLDLLSAVLQAMERHHYEAVKDLAVGETFSRICLTGRAGSAIQQLVQGMGRIETLAEGSLRGVARLFA